MAKEIERKFLVADDRWRAGAGPGVTMRQGYVAAMDDRTVRVRILGGETGRLTIKIGTGAMTRDEFEYDIPLDDAQDIMTAAIGIVIEKTRYRIAAPPFVWEVDVFEGPYAGLIVAEVEMHAETDTPRLPSWLGREVTTDPRYSNYAMATMAEGGREALRGGDCAGPPDALFHAS